MVQTQFVDDHADLSTAINILDKWLAHRVYETHLPGLAMGIVHHGDLLWGNGYGYADVEKQIPISLDTRFRIASITKTFTAIAIMQLYETGKLRLDDPIADYLAWFDLQYPDSPPITIYHCLTHTSGLPRDATAPHWTENEFQDWDAVIATTKSRQLLMPPLQDHSYSNLGYTLLGGVIEAVAGESWSDYIQRHIVDELGMRDTVVAPKGDEVNLAIGYLTPQADYSRQAVPFIETKGFSPSASMASSVRDLVTYAKFHLSKGQTPLLSSHGLRDMHRFHWLQDDWARGYGLGIRIWHINDWTVSGHTGGYKGFSTMFSVCREHDFGVIALTNSIDSFPFGYAERAYKLILPEILKITEKPPQVDPIWQDYVGTYLSDWDNFEVVVRNGQLQIINLRFIDDAPTILEPTDEADTFIISVPGNPGETGRFERDDSGQVVRYYSRNEYAIKK